MTYFYHAVYDSSYLPRDLEASSAQSAVVTVLGELWPCQDAVLVPSAAIVSVLERADLTATSVRAALSRLSRKRTLDVIKDGRHTLYRLSADVRATIPASQDMTMRFGAHEREWTGEWTIVVYSMPETERTKRSRLREWLRWLGFGPLHDGVWIAPHADLQLVQQAVSHILPPDGLLFRATLAAGEIDTSSMWPLATLAEEYGRFIDEFRPAVYRLRAGSVPPAEALRLWLTVLGRWRGFPTLDPDLPSSALPPDWPRREARHLFETVHDATVLLAAPLVSQIVGRFSPEAAASLRARTVAQVIDELANAHSPQPSGVDLKNLGFPDTSPPSVVMLTRLAPPSRTPAEVMPVNERASVQPFPPGLLRREQAQWVRGGAASDQCGDGALTAGDLVARGPLTD